MAFLAGKDATGAFTREEKAAFLGDGLGHGLGLLWIELLHRLDGLHHFLHQRIRSVFGVSQIHVRFN